MHEKTPQKKIRLVLVGGGHANTQVIKLLQGTNVPAHVERILVSNYATSLYSGMCPGGVAEQYTEAQFSIDLPKCAQAWGWKFICKKLVEIKADKNTLVTSDGTHIQYDILVLNIGSANVGYDTCEGAAKYAVCTRPLKLLMDKVNQAEQRLFQKIKQKALSHTKQKPLKLHFITVGSGCAGCELIMGLTERLRKSIQQYVTDQHLELAWELHATLVTNSTTILAKDPSALGLAVLKTLQAKNIHILTHHKIIKVGPQKAYALHHNKTKKLDYDILLWATGAASHPIKSHNIARDHHGWFQVNKHLQSISHPNIFGTGDCASLIDYNGMDFPPKAGVYAVRQGPILAHNLQRYIQHLSHGEQPNFQAYRPQTDFLRLLNTGDGKAIGVRFGLALKGAWVWKLKDWIDKRWIRKFDLPDN